MRIADINVIIKIISIIYICLLSINIMEANFIVIILILLYLIFSFLNEFINSYIRFALIVMEIIVSLVLSIKFIDMAILLTVISVIQYVYKIFKSELLAVVLGVCPIIFTLDTSKIKDSIYIYALLLIIFLVKNKVTSKNILLEQNIDEQRKTIYKLQQKLKEERGSIEQLLYTAKLEERNKISGNLHDKIGHTISGTVLQLEAVKVIFNRDEKKAKESLDIAINNLRLGMNDIRATLKNIKPQQEELGINRMKLILEEKTKNTSYNFKIKYSGILDNVSTLNWILFIEAVKELSTNSIKYSKGDLIEINLDVLNAIIKLEVKDNGVGGKNIKKGMGLSNLEDKVGQRDGKIIINGDNGFSVIILMPFK